MNPFDMPGPEFLVFYALVGVMLVGGLVLYRHMTGGGSGAPLNFSDPYAIAYLRGGKQELLQLATLVLIERGDLVVDDLRIRPEGRLPTAATKHPLEITLLEEFHRTSVPQSVYSGDVVQKELRGYEQTLVEQGAWISDADDYKIAGYRLFVIVALLAVAGIKIGLAIERGRYNIGFLILLAAGFMLAAHFVYRHRRTARGSQYLSHMRALVEQSRAAGQDPGQGELLMLGAVLGVTALPAMLQSYSASMFEAITGKRERDQRDTSDTYSDSSDSGGGGDGGGSGCGGCSSG